MKYILEGPQADVVLQENRYRIAMGMVKITPVADEVEEPAEEAPVKELAEDTPEVPAEDTDVEETAAEEVPEEPAEDTKEVPVEDAKEVPAEVEKADTEVEDTKEVAPADEKKPAKKAKK